MMNFLDELALFGIRRRHAALREEWEALKREYAGKYDPDQPRVPAGNTDGGQWTAAGANGTSTESGDDWSSGGTGFAVAASRRRKFEANCEFQYERDVFQCRIVGLPSCYAQAMVRYKACLRGDPIPPLNY